MIFICKNCGAMSLSYKKPEFCYLDRNQVIEQISVKQARDIGLYNFWTANGLIPRSLTKEETIKINELVEIQKVCIPEFPGEVKFDDFTGEQVKPMHGHVLVSKQERKDKMNKVLGA
jgi:hypothetical protein